MRSFGHQARPVGTVGVVLLTGILVGGVACARVSYVTVPEAQFRSEQALDERITLPLSSTDESRLRQFLMAGGNNDATELDTPDPALRARYDALLSRLRQPLTRAALLDDKILQPWLNKGMLRQVVDARADRPPIIAPIAVGDERFWWIFYHTGGNVNALMVVRRLQQRRT